MALTPEDVHNVAFSKPPIGKRGYDEDQVDDFLELVERELASYLVELSALRHEVSVLKRQLGNGSRDLYRFGL
jgi:DivIVA domain-containing protein